jgi:hypothetical protein
LIIEQEINVGTAVVNQKMVCIARNVLPDLENNEIPVVRWNNPTDALGNDNPTEAITMRFVKAPEKNAANLAAECNQANVFCVYDKDLANQLNGANDKGMSGNYNIGQDRRVVVGLYRGGPNPRGVPVAGVTTNVFVFYSIAGFRNEIKALVGRMACWRTIV